MGCASCAQKSAARAAAKQAKGKSTGSWSVTLIEGTRQGERHFFDNKLAAMAFNIDNGGKGMIRQVV